MCSLLSFPFRGFGTLPNLSLIHIFASLEAIMKQNTGFYQSDLDIDKEIIAKAAASPNREDLSLIHI